MNENDIANAGETLYPATKPVCQLDANGYYAGRAEADLSPMEADAGVYLLPAMCIDTTPPEERPGKLAFWDVGTETWQYLPDHRGETVYSTAGGESLLIEQPGNYPEGYTTEPRPSHYHTFADGRWQISTGNANIKREAEQAAVWEAIKNKRHANLRGGVYLDSVSKWFQTDDATRQQYTFMRTLPELPPGMQWKTMDNSFIEMTKTLLDELSIKLLTDEQADFTNAERHRAAMLAAAEPLDYDYSSGWTATYEAAA
ncbi:DUF4376 domain-containing protein [Uruburuella testudinis]|uniref:DUF4376 domain-containing protein n=1 Tax=Uruburuella testudinis TaxID=1282863 RepID=A0ABY4DUP0_9NEIS|nr:DUF4376 domain-containing protein [Uruburuella testudinis]UOO82756.1 DUF4376 domain-containing protein [Uruburuella testudinis]